MISLEARSSSDNTSETTNLLLNKVKELLNITKERLKKYPQHPLHSKLKEEILDLQIDIDFNGSSNNGQFLFMFSSCIIYLIFLHF